MITNPLLEDWELWHFAAGRSPITTAERLRVLDRFATETRCDLAAVSPREIIRWFAGNRSRWSDSTIATYHAYFVAFFKWMQLTDRRLDNPMLKVGSPKYPDREPRPVSDAALVQLLCTPMHTRTRHMILLAALAGLRVSEIARIKGEDVDVTKPSIRVRGKGGKVRTIPMHVLLVQAAGRMPTRGYWFPANSNRPGECLHGKSVSQTVGDAMRRAGIAGTPHALRHWYGSSLLAGGADLRTVQELLRHASVATTQIYTKVPDQRRIDAISRLNPYIWNDAA